MFFVRRFAFISSLMSLLQILYVVAGTPSYYMSGFLDRKRSSASPNRKHSKPTRQQTIAIIDCVSFQAVLARS